MLGNRKGIAQVAFTGAAGLSLAMAFTLLKPTATTACLGSGAIGGMLTHSLATGALLRAATGQP